MSKQICVADIIAKRKARWNEKRDLKYDEELVNASVVKILSTESLTREILARPYLLVEVAFYIINKDKATVPFFFNEVQQDFISKLEEYGGGRHYFILKGRQQGFTSVVTAIQLAFAIVRKNFSGFTMADRADNTRAIFNDKARVVFDKLPELLKPSTKFNSTNEFFFDKLNSSWRIATATDQVGRSRTLNFAHFSEVAFYTCSLANLQKGIGEALTADSFQIYETTANGYNEARELWESKTCINLFYEWWRTKEYRSTEYKYLETDDPWLLNRIEILKSKGLDKEQITWYCKKYDGYIDKDSLKQEYPCSADEAFISSGGSIFDKEKLNNRITACSDLRPLKLGYFDYRKEYVPIIDPGGAKVGEEKRLTDIRFIESKDGYIRLHELPQEKKDGRGNVIGLAPYVIGGDTAGTGEDYFAAKVINNITGRTAATLHRKNMDEDVYAEQLICLGKYYHDALIGVEINYSREPMRIIAQEYGYVNVYMREKLDGVHDEVVLDAGFNTTPKTRPIIIAELVRLFRDDPEIECDSETLKEMNSFVKKANGRQEALDGFHDDLVMSLAIAHFVAGQQATEWLKPEAPEDDFIKRNFKESEESDAGYYGNSQTFGESGGAFMDWDDF